MANKLLPCICGGNGVTVDAEPLKEELEKWERRGQKLADKVHFRRASRQRRYEEREGRRNEV